MYELLHSERIESPPINGVVYIAQILGGKVHYSARLEHGVPREDGKENYFELREDEWRGDRAVYVIDLRKVYRVPFDTTNEASDWRIDVVQPWVVATKKKFLQDRIDASKRHLEQMERAYSLLDNVAPTL